jgi:hypothetical protein
MKAKLIKVDDIYTLMDGDKMIASSDSDFQTDYEVMKLSKENCNEIFGVIDVEEIALSKASYFGGTYRNPEGFSDKQVGYLHGFIEGAELNKNKLFTVDDLYRAFLINSAGNNTTLRNFFEQTVLPMFEQPKEIEVRIAMGCSLPNGCTEPEVECTCEPTYNLDKNGCLTLWVLNI